MNWSREVNATKIAAVNCIKIHTTFIHPLADQGFFEGGDFGNPMRTERVGLTGEFYAFVNYVVDIISIV